MLFAAGAFALAGAVSAQVPMPINTPTGNPPSVLAGDGAGPHPVGGPEALRPASGQPATPRAIELSPSSQPVGRTNPTATVTTDPTRDNSERQISNARSAVPTGPGAGVDVYR